MWGLIRLMAVSGLVLALSTAARAQETAAPCQLCSASEQAEAAAKSPPAQIDIQTSLDFDRLVVTGAAGGTAQIRPDGSATTSGAVQISGRAMVGTAVIRGEAGRLVRVELPSSIALDGPSGGQIVIDRLTTDLPDMPRLDSNGRLEFRFGGAGQVVGDAEGNYRGDVAITVEYL